MLADFQICISVPLSGLYLVYLNLADILVAHVRRILEYT